MHIFSISECTLEETSFDRFQHILYLGVRVWSIITAREEGKFNNVTRCIFEGNLAFPYINIGKVELAWKSSKLIPKYFW